MTMRNPVKIGARVYLRPLEVTDAQAIMIASHTEAEPGFQNHGRVPTSVMAFETWIRGLSGTATPEAVAFAICKPGVDRCLGTVMIRHIDWINRTGETGTGLLSAEDRGKGIGTEAKHLLLEYAFNDLRLHVLTAMVFSGNARSAAALAKQGYRLAGRLTADVQRGGTFHDTLVFDITRQDWEQAHARWRDRAIRRDGDAAN